MKKLSTFIMTVLSLFTLVACSSQQTSHHTHTDNQAHESQVASTTQQVQHSQQVTTENNELKSKHQEPTIEQVDTQQSQDSQLNLSPTFEDFQDLYVTFEGEQYNSRPESQLEILPGEIRVGWPQSEYISYQIIDHQISGQTLTATTHELDMDGKPVGEHVFEFSLSQSKDSKSVTSSETGVTFFQISSEEYETLIQRDSNL